MIVYRTGNLGVGQLQAAWRGLPLPDPADERRKLPVWRALGFRQVEDYVCWAVAEPQPGRFDFSLARDNAIAARRAGLDPWAFLWFHVSPPWWRAGGDFVPARRIGDGKAALVPSLFAPSTERAAERFWRAAGEALADLVDGVVVGFPADYGEVGYPSGLADWLVVDEGRGDHHSLDFWCDEEPARAAFVAHVRRRYQGPSEAAAAWRMAPERAWIAPWPRPGATARHRADFADFYRGAVTRWTRRLLDLAEQAFPGASREVKVGHCSEALPLGRDLAGIVAACAEAGAVVRSTQSGMDELFTARLASLCRGHGAAFATEAAREIGPEQLSRRVFVDLSHGTSAYFEYPEQLAATRGALAAAAPAVGAGPAQRPVACFYPTASLPLHPGAGVPEDLAHAHPWLRRLTDLEILDEDQVRSGALDAHAALVWLDDVLLDEPAPQDVLLEVEAWVRRGGVLLWSAPPLEPALAGGLAGATRSVVRHLRYALATPDQARVSPGEIASRPFLAEGWLGREDARWAWPDGEPGVVAARWTSGRAVALLPRPARAEVTLVIELWVPADVGRARVAVVDGHGERIAATVTRAGAHSVVLPVRATRGEGDEDDDVLRVVISSPTYCQPARGRAFDVRDLGVLVRDCWAGGAGDEPDVGARQTAEAVLAGGPRVPLAAAETLAVRLGDGVVLPGDGSPLSAMAWLRTALEGGVPGVALPPVPRDRGARCLVARWPDGVLVHNPDPLRPAAPELVGVDGVESATAGGPLAPLETRWIAGAPASTMVRPLPDPRRTTWSP